jgi:hypothetical protein
LSWLRLWYGLSWCWNRNHGLSWLLVEALYKHGRRWGWNQGLSCELLVQPTTELSTIWNREAGIISYNQIHASVSTNLLWKGRVGHFLPLHPTPSPHLSLPTSPHSLEVVPDLMRSNGAYPVVLSPPFIASLTISCRARKVTKTVFVTGVRVGLRSNNQGTP